jgi:hypothetical protein
MDTQKQLLAALERLLECYCALANSGDAGNWDPEEQAEVIQARAAIAAAKPTIDWTKLPEWVKWVACDESGIWWAYKNKPEIGNKVWFTHTEMHEHFYAIEKQFTPSFSVDWKDSLIERPAV